MDQRRLSTIQDGMLTKTIIAAIMMAGEARETLAGEVNLQHRARKVQAGTTERRINNVRVAGQAIIEKATMETEMSLVDPEVVTKANGAVVMGPVLITKTRGIMNQPALNC
jgi:hypothetical protein